MDSLSLRSFRGSRRGPSLPEPRSAWSESGALGYSFLRPTRPRSTPSWATTQNVPQKDSLLPSCGTRVVRFTRLCYYHSSRGSRVRTESLRDTDVALRRRAPPSLTVKGIKCQLIPSVLPLLGYDRCSYCESPLGRRSVVPGPSTGLAHLTVLYVTPPSIPPDPR